jgi:hypothetical protein
MNTVICQPPETPNSQNIDLRQNNVYIQTLICLIVYRVINSDVIFGYEILLHTRVSTIKRFLIRHFAVCPSSILITPMVSSNSS